MLTELTFCRKASINISIDNRYYNWFIHLRRPIFPVKHNVAALCLQSRPHLGSRMRVSRCYTCEAPVAQSETWVGSSLLDSSMILLFRQPITSPIIVFAPGPAGLLVQTHLQSFNDHERRIIFSASATSPAPPAILSFFLVVNDGDCAMTSCIRRAPENMSHKNIIAIYFRSWA